MTDHPYQMPIASFSVEHYLSPGSVLLSSESRQDKLHVCQEIFEF